MSSFGPAALSRIIAGGFVGLFASAWMYWLKLHWFKHAPEGFVFYGILQGDQKIYAALVRAAMKSPNGFTYVYPWDFSPDAPAIFFQLPITLMAWMGRALPGLPLHDIFDLFRIGSAIILFSSLAWLIHLYFPQRRIYWAVYAMAAFGGGIASYITLARLGRIPFDNITKFFAAFQKEELNYHWWFLDVFRNVYYPLETFYHALFFLMIVFILTRRPAAAIAVYAAGLSSNPFLGIQLTSVLMPALALDLWQSRTKRNWITLAIAAAFFALFLAYYKIFLNSFDIGRTLQAQQEGAGYKPLSVMDMVRGYGPFLLIFIASLLDRRFLRRQWRARGRRILILWIAVTFALVNHSRIISLDLQPLHFERGYLFLPLVVWGFQYLFFRLRPRFPDLRAAAWRPVAILGCGVLLLIPDTLSFMYIQARYPPKRDEIIFDKSCDEVIRHFEGYSGRVIVVEDSLSKMLTAHTGTSTYTADRYVTPHFADRDKIFKDFTRTADFSILGGEYKVTAFVLERAKFDDAMKNGAEAMTILFPKDKFRITLVNARWVVIEKILAD